jgi:cytoskeletal protein CcmA (bactofilin family)
VLFRSESPPGIGSPLTEPKTGPPVLLYWFRAGWAMMAQLLGWAPMQSVLPSTEITALLGRGTHFEGKLHFEGRVRIDGSFRGEIRSQDILIIGEGADVEADIEVGTAIIKGGAVTGDVRALHAIELYVPARVSGSLHAPEIFMDKGVQFSGSCTMAPL